MNEVLKKCPNCGADIIHNYNHRCPYCRTYLHMTDDEIKKINNCEYKVENVYLDRNPIRHSFILTITGWTTPKFYNYEEMQENTFIVSGNDINKKVAYRVEIPMELIMRLDDREIVDYVLRSMPPEFCNGYNEDKILQGFYEQFNKIRGF
jgi:Zn-finger nucleic acid-binding protein